MDKSKKIVYPGERAFETRKNNLANGMPVMKKMWVEIMEF
jgi:LDH2 family malate/lactate/ureidoglycolate dehydrogenase